MTAGSDIPPDMLMAYADGELGPLDAKRVERAIAADPALAAEVERHRALRDRIAGSFAPIADEPVPDRLAALLQSNVVPLPLPAPRPILTRWREASALAACLVLGLVIGVGVPRDGPVAARSDGLYAAGPLARALDTQAGAADGAVRVAVSFRDRKGAYCRVFGSAAADGIACRDANGWALRRTQQGAAPRSAGGYAQAGSIDPELMAAAQDMMAGEPLDAAAEKAARDAGWR
ncbi:MAG TPA: anti-sigma factor [Sphingomonas sp.]